MAEPIMPEQMPVPEQGGEQAEQQESKQIEKDPQPSPQPTVSTTASLPDIPEGTSTSSQLPKETVKSETLEEIEHIMEEDLDGLYKDLPANARKEFREKGEETAKEIEGMMYQVKVKSKTVFKLIFGWLRIIPGVNQYFLKQEAHIKTDEIMHLKDKMDQGDPNDV